MGKYEKKTAVFPKGFGRIEEELYERPQSNWGSIGLKKK